jgi:thiol-disulfide isomerase/thioredoxin
MGSRLSIVAGVAAGLLVAAGVLLGFIFVGPDPIGLRPSPSPSQVAVASPSPSGEPSSVASASPGASGSAAAGSPGASGSVAASAFHIGQPAPPLVIPQVGGGTIDLAALKGKAVWINFMQTSCPECLDEFPLMNGYAARYGDKGLVIIAVDIREDEGTVAAFGERLGAAFPLGLDADGAAQRTWGAYALPVHFWIDREGVVREGALGGIGGDVMVAALKKILPGVVVE